MQDSSVKLLVMRMDWCHCSSQQTKLAFWKCDYSVDCRLQPLSGCTSHANFWLYKALVWKKHRWKTPLFLYEWSCSVRWSLINIWPLGPEENFSKFRVFIAYDFTEQAELGMIFSGPKLLDAWCPVPRVSDECCSIRKGTETKSRSSQSQQCTRQDRCQFGEAHCFVWFESIPSVWLPLPAVETKPRQHKTKWEGLSNILEHMWWTEQVTPIHTYTRVTELKPLWTPAFHLCTWCATNVMHTIRLCMCRAGCFNYLHGAKINGWVPAKWLDQFTWAATLNIRNIAQET